jgi:predicted naringenin-chalcone synthase
LTNVYINLIATAVPPHDIHRRFADFVPKLLSVARQRPVFNRMVARSNIEHRYSFLKADPEGRELDGDAFYRRNQFPDTKSRMAFYEKHAFELAGKALDRLKLQSFGDSVTHVIVASCTGFYAPGLDLQIVEHYGLSSSTERTIVGFMGCYAAFNALKLAWHTVRSQPNAKVIIVNLELCTLHLQETANLEQLLSYLIFADGCAATLISAEPHGIECKSFFSAIIPDSKDQITWAIGNQGFDMVLSGQVPTTITRALPDLHGQIFGGNKQDQIQHWAIHPGGRSILDAVQKSLDLNDVAMAPSRAVLRDFGNMSSATIMFVLKAILENEGTLGLGCAMAFGPGVTLESMLFNKINSI